MKTFVPKTPMMKYVVEFVGTLLFLFVILKFPNALAIGAALALVIFLGGNISGGHFNPAVSIMKYAQGAIKMNDLVAYMIVQIACGLVALMIYKMVK